MSNILSVKKDLYTLMCRLMNSIRELMKFIEMTSNFEPRSKAYQKEWLEIIDKELAKGQREASFWKEKTRKY